MNRSVIILACMYVAFANALPAAPLSPRAFHSCSVFIQRWSDNSFDIYDYNFSPAPSASEPWNYIISAESIPLSAGQQLPPTTIGSNTLIITNVANPSTEAPNTDPGRLSFTWGDQSWNTFEGAACSTTPRGDRFGAAPTNTSCTFQCDA
ncbi:hypothetical protein PVAG01_05358 [Phlyctema vagabunda]|uniref:Uncharacterized protein n=1 Tax=Phlyctema vagabunda TaxID=108571 RepID=A0ABR4PJU5_9HELO